MASVGSSGCVFCVVFYTGWGNIRLRGCFRGIDQMHGLYGVLHALGQCQINELLLWGRPNITFCMKSYMQCSDISSTGSLNNLSGREGPRDSKEFRGRCLMDRQKVRQKVGRRSWMLSLATNKEGFQTNRTKIPWVLMLDVALAFRSLWEDTGKTESHPWECPHLTFLLCFTRLGRISAQRI